VTATFDSGNRDEPHMEISQQNDGQALTPMILDEIDDGSELVEVDRLPFPSWLGLYKTGYPVINVQNFEEKFLVGSYRTTIHALSRFVLENIKYKNKQFFNYNGLKIMSLDVQRANPFVREQLLWEYYNRVNLPTNIVSRDILLSETDMNEATKYVFIHTKVLNFIKLEITKNYYADLFSSDSIPVKDLVQLMMVIHAEKELQSQLPVVMVPIANSSANLLDGNGN
jgi:hypothetical protein